MSKRFQRLATILVTIGMVMSLLPEPALAEMADGLVGTTGEEQTIIVEDSTQEGVQEETATDQADTVEGGGTEEEEVVVTDTAADDETEVAEEAAVNETITEAQAADETEVFVEEAETETVAEEAADDVVTDPVAKIGETGYATLPEAVAAAANGDTIVLQKDAEGDGVALWAADQKTITINLNSFTYTVSGTLVGSTGTETQAFHFEKGNTVTIKNGTLKTTNALMLIQNYCDLTLDNVTVDGTGLQGSHRYVVSNNNGSLTVKGATDITAKEGDIAFDVWYSENYSNGVAVTFDDSFTGTVTGDMEYGAANGATEGWESKTSLTINGTGTFTGSVKPGNNNDLSTGTITVNAEGLTKVLAADGTLLLATNEQLDAAVVTIEDQEYTGSALTPTATVLVDGIEIDNSACSYRKWKNNTNVGDATVIVSAYDGKIESAVTFDITAIDLSTYTVNLSGSKFAYTGEEIKPTVTVTKDDAELSSSLYTVTYASNTDAGFATVTVAGDGTNVVNEATATFEIVDAAAKIGDTFFDTFEDAVAAAKAGDTLEILKAGTYTLPNSLPNITVKGNVANVVFTHTGTGSIASIPDGATFESVTFFFGGNNYHGFQHAGTINMNNCTLNGKFFSYADMTFSGCTFNAPGTDASGVSNKDYSMWAYAGNLTYTNCTFNGAGKFINVYNESGATRYTISATGCSFNSTESNKAAFNVKETCGTKVLQYTVNVSDCTTTGSFPEASDNGTLTVINSLVQVDDRKVGGTMEGGEVVVKVDGEQAYSTPRIARVAAIGDEQFISLQAAIDKATELGGNVTIDVFAGVVELPATAVIPEGVTIKGAGTDKTTLKITTSNGDGVKLTNPNVTIKDLAIDGSEITSGGYKSLINVEANDCVVDNVVMTGGGKSTWNSSILIENLKADQTFTVKNSNISGSFRGVLRESCNANIVIENSELDAVYPFNIDGGSAGTVAVSASKLHGWTSYSGVDKVTFTNCEFSKGKSGYDCIAAYVDTEFVNCTFDSSFDVYAQTSPFNFTFKGCIKDSTPVTREDFKEQFPNDSDVWNKCDTYVDGKLVGAVAEVTDGTTTKEYKTLQAAIDAAYEMNGDVTIKLVANIIESVSIQQKRTLNLTIDGANKTITGQIGIKAGFLDDDTLTIKNLNFKYGEGVNAGNGFVYFITGSALADGHNVTVEECAFDGTGSNDEIPALKATSGSQCRNLTIKDSTVTKVHSLAQLVGTTGATITGNTGDVHNGINISGGASDFVISNNQLSGDGYTVRVKDGSSAQVVLENNVLVTTSTEEGIINEAKSDATITIKSGKYAGPLTMGNSGKIVISGGVFNTVPGLDQCADGVYPIANTDADTKADYPYTVGAAVASVTTGDGDEATTTYYATFAEAVTAAGNDNVITLLDDIADEYELPAGNTLMVKLGGHDLTVKAPAGMVLKTADADGVTTYTVAGAVASITKDGVTTNYGTVAEAVAASVAGDTIKLIADDHAENVVVKDGKKLTLDLNGKTLTGYVDVYDADVTVANGTLAGTVHANGSEADAAYGHVTIAEDATVQADYGVIVWQAVYGSGYGATVDIDGTVNGVVWVMGNITDLGDNPSTINVNGTAKITGNDVGIALNGAAVVNVAEGAAVTGTATGIEVRAGKLNVAGGTITGQGEELSVAANGSGTTTSGAGIAIAQHTTKLPIEVVISGGTIKGGGAAFSVANPQDNADNAPSISVSGGYFSGDFVNDDDRVTEGFVSGGYFSNDTVDDCAVAGKNAVANLEAATKDEYPFVIGEGIASVTSTDGTVVVYTSLPDAVAAAKTGETVTLLKDASGAGIFLAAADAKSITIDLNDCTYTVSGPAVGSTGTATQGLHAEKGNAITLKNGTFTSTADSGVYMLVQNYCDLTLEDVTLDGTSLPGSKPYTLSNNCGKVTIGSGTTIIAKEGGYAFDVCSTNYYPDGAQVTVADGATINGNIELGVWGSAPATNKATLTVNGGAINGKIVNASNGAIAKADVVLNAGVYTDDPSESVEATYPLACYPVKNADNKYEIKPSLESEDIEVLFVAATPERTYAFTGFEIKPVTGVQVNKGVSQLEKLTAHIGLPITDKVALEADDYTVTYENNINAGTATATITGTEGSLFAGTSTTREFKITKVDLATCTIDEIADVEYTGEAHTPEPVVKHGDYTLVKGADYTVSYTNNTNVGEATVTITAVEDGNFTGTNSVTFNITSKDLSNAEITITAGTSFDYTSEEIKPAITVKLNGEELSSETDYDVTYEENVRTGIAIITVTGKGNYSGTASTEFRIHGTSINTATVVVDPLEYTYDGTAKTPEVKSVTMKINGEPITLVKDEDYTVQYINNVNAGTAQIVLFGIADFSGGQVIEFTINKATVAAPTATDHTYDGNEQTGVATGTGYVLTGDAKATNAGDYIAIATLSDPENYTWNDEDKTTAPKELSWNIAQASATIEIGEINSQVYNGTALEPAVTVTTTPANVAYELTYSNNVEVGEATVTATITDPNYTAKPVDAYFDIVAAVAEVNGYNYGTLQEAIAAVPTDGTATTVRLLTDITEANVSPEGDYDHDLVAINGNRNVVLDMDGKSLTTDFMYVLNGSLEVMGGTVNNTIYVYGLDTANSGMKSDLKVDSDATIAADYGVVLQNLSGKTAAYDATIDIDGTVNGIVWVMGNITEGNSVINVNADAQIKGNDVGIALNGMATVNVNDGATVTGTATGIEARSGNLNVYGGIITGQGTTFSVGANGNGTTTSGAGIAIAQHTTKKPVNVNVYGGTISGYQAVCASDPQNNGDFANVNVTLTDGTFLSTADEGKSVLVAKEGMTITIEGGAYSDDNGNNYAVPEGKFLAQDEDGLYRLNDFLKVTPPEGMELVYNGSEQNGVKAGEGYTLSGTTAATEAGGYFAIAKLADHYEWDDGSRGDLRIAWTIAKAPVTVTADDASKVFGATDPTLTATVGEGLFNDDTLAATYYTVARAAGEDVGTYAITVTDAGTNKNYVINGVDGTFTITPAKLPAPEAISDQLYTGQALTPTVVIKNGEATLTENTDYTVVSYLNNTELGEAAVIITGAGNYTGMQIAKFNIVEANKDALKAALDAANAARVATSDAKGFDLESGTAYVTSEVQNDLTAAIEAAQAVYDNSAATEEEIAAAAIALNKAVDTYKSQIKYAKAAVAKIGDTLYTSLADAVAASTDGETVELLVDASGAGIFLAAADEKAITIDLGGHTYTVTGPAVGSTNTATQGLHAEKGNAVTLRNGTFTSTADSGVYMLVQNYCDLTLEDVALDGTNLPGNGCYALSNNCGVVTIGSGTTITANEGSYAFDVCATDYYPAGAQVTVEEGATINGDVQYDVWGTKPADNKATLTVNGGTFNGSFDVEAALADDAETNIVINGGAFKDYSGHGYEKDGYTLVQEDDGYYRLTPQIDLATATITLTEAEYVYDKSEKLPAVSVTDADGNVVDSNLYTTDVASKTDVGSYTVTVTAAEDQTLVINEGTASWAIVPAALTSAAAADIAYTGEAVTPNLVVYAGDTTVTASDYTVTYADAAGNAVTELKKVGSYVATITGKGNYGGTVVCSFDISQSVAAVTVEAIADQTYDGNPKTPALVVKADGVATTEYTATWINNVNAGTAVVQVTLTGAKTGEALATFTIKPAEVAAPTAAENLVYNGSEQIGVAAGDHYTVTDGAATDAGKYRAVAQLKSANYAWSDGTTTAKLIDWSIAKANVTVTIADIPAQLYSGSAIEPEVTVTTNPKGVAYELSFSNNVEAGNATVTVTTTDPNYNTVIETKDFTIKAAVAKIGDTYFSSVNAAVEAAQDGDTIELLVNKTEKVKVADKTITLDLGGFELSDQKCPLEVSGSADVTVTNGTLKANSYGARVVDSATLTVTDGTTVQSGTWGVYAGNTATLNVKGGEITGVLAISTNGLANQDATINISGGVVNGTVADSDKYSAGVYLPSGTLNITGGTVTGNEAAIAQRGGTVSISGGELSYTNTDAEHVGSIGDRTNSMPVGVIVVDVMTSAYPAAPGATVAAVEGAKLMAPADGSIVTGFVATDADAVTLNEGVITSEVPVEASIADGCYAKSTDDGLYVITALTELASIDAIDVQAYTGSAIEPAVTVYDENGDVVDPANYEVTYEDNIDAGAATVTVKATGEGYTGELTATFVIAKGTLAGAEVTVDPDSNVFDGSAKEPAVTVTLDGEVLDPTSYTVAYDNNTNAGTATVTITAAEDGLYDGTTGANFTITPADMNSVTVETSTKTYTGQKQVVDSVKLGDYELTAADYDIVYVDNVEVGTATAVLSGKGNFEGMISATFEIVGIDLSEAEVTLDPTSFTYDGSAKEPTVTVTLNDAVIDPANYDVAYADNVEAGTGTATVTGKGGYTGSKSAEFAIVALDKSALAQALNDADAARVAVSDENGFDLEPGTEYVPSAADEALTEAIEAAQAVYDNPAATEEQIAQATKDLNDAIETYKAKIKVAEAAVAMNVETGAYYATLAKAVTGAKNGQTIQMVADTTVSTRIAQRLIAPTYTLDLNGHTVTYDNAASIYHSMPMTREGTITVTDTTGNGKMLFTTDDGFSVSSGATLVVTGGATLKATGDFSPIVVGKNGNVVIENDAAIVADASFAIAATGNDGNGGYSIDVTGGTITSNDVAIYHPNAGTLTISGGEITGATAVYVKSGTTTVSGGTITGTGEKTAYTANGNGANPTGDAFVVETCGYPGGDPSVTITDGTFVSENAEAVAAYATEGKTPAEGFVSGGWFSNEVKDEYCAEGLAPTAEIGEAPAPFTVAEPEITITIGDYTKAYGEVDPEFTAEVENNLGKVIEYTITREKGENAGVYTITATVTGYEADVLEGSLTIERVDIATATVTASEKTYDGSEKTIDSIVLGDYALVEGKDYDVVYVNNVEVGTASAVIVGKGNFIGATTTEFAIVPAALEGATIDAIDDQTFTGSEIEPEVTVRDAEGNVIDPANYTVSYENNTAIGKATVTVTLSGNYTGEVTGTFDIVAPSKKELKKAIEDATAAENGIKVSEDGSNLQPGDTYVPQAAQDALDAAQAAAQAVYDNPNATPDEIAQATKNLNDAIEAYEAAKQVVAEPEPEVIEVPEAVEDLVYNGSEQTGVEDGDGYTVTDGTAINAGTYKATVTLTDPDNSTWADGTTDPKTVEFEISKATEDDWDVAAIADQTYTGSAIEPALTVTLKANGAKLTEGTDYEVLYTNNTDAGTATVVVVGKGNLSGTKMPRFTITPATVEVPTAETGLTYTGDVQTGVKEGDEYKLSGNTGTDAGDYTATVKLADAKNYTWTDGTTEEKSVAWTIGAADASKITVADVEDQNYTGSEIKPTPVVTFNGKVLTPDTDFTFSYENNTNVGEATITVTAKSANFTGSTTKTFKIVAGKVEIPTGKTLTFTGAEQTGVDTGNGYTLSGNTGTDASEYTATAKLADATNFTWADGTTEDKSVAWKIEAADISALTVSEVEDETYTGSEIKPTPEVKLGSVVLTADKDYALTYADNVNAGKATITVTGKGNVTGTKDVNFTIAPVSLTECDASVEDQPYTKTARKPVPTVTYGELELANGTDFTIKGYEKNIKPGYGTVTIEGKGNYVDSVTLEFIIRFKDVPPEHEYYEDVHRAASLGLVNGYSGAQLGNFGPEDSLQRCQVAVMLWNLAGKPAPEGESKDFKDIKGTEYYASAVAWASSVGVVNGYSGARTGYFGPTDPVQHEELCTMVANYAKNIAGKTVAGTRDDFASFSDAAAVKNWAVKSVGFCFSNGLTTGFKGKINPQGEATRAETASMVYRLYLMING